MEILKDKNRGSFIFTSDWKGSEYYQNARRQLSRLAKKGVLIKYGAGIYYYPVIDHKYGLGIIKVSNSEIAKAYAQKNNLELYDTPLSAQNKLGLTSQNQLNVVYLTNGRSLHIDTDNNRGITLIHINDTKLRLFRSSVMRTLALALKDYKENELDELELSIITNHIQRVNRKDYEHDIKLMKGWERKVLANCARNNS